MAGLCRLCASLRKVDLLVIIEDDTNDICEKLRKCCQLNIKMEDALPKSVCQDCVKNLYNYHKFYNKVNEAQETLQALYPTASTQEETEKEIVTMCHSSLVETLSVVEENVKKRKSCVINQDEEVTYDRNDKQNKERRIINLKQVKLKRFLVDKPKESENNFLAEKNVTDKPRENYIQKVYELLEMTENDAVIEGSFEMLNNIDENDEVCKENYSGYEDVNESQEEIHMESNVSEQVNNKIPLEFSNDNEEFLPESEEFEYYEDEEEDLVVDMNFEKFLIKDQNEKSPSSLPSQLILKSWKNYKHLCFLCDCVFNNFIALKRHLNKNHNIIDIERFKYKCYDCQKIIPRYNFFLNHIRSKHHPDLKLKCEVCDFSSENFEELSYHRSTNCSEANNFGNIVPCNQCFKSFPNLYALQNHKKFLHDNDKVKYQCEECKKSFMYKSCLKVHAQLHTERQTHVCTICDSIFNSKISMDQHISKHLDDNVYKCNVCNKSFKSFLTLDQHQNIHTQQKLFQCDFCTKTFVKKIQKINHERTHTGEMPFSCSECDRPFRFLSALNAHLKIHTGAKPYSCEYCDKTFADVSNRNKHVRRVHPTKNIKM